jgi:hypothetical protein
LALTAIASASQAQQQSDVEQSLPALQEGNAYWFKLPSHVRNTMLQHNGGNIPPAYQLHPPTRPNKIKYNEPLPMDNPPLPWIHYNTDTYTPSIVTGMLLGIKMTFISPECQVHLSFGDLEASHCVDDEVKQHQKLIEQHNAEEEQRTKVAQQAASKAVLDERDPKVHAARVHNYKARIDFFTTQLNHEKRIVQISGVVDMQVLHSWGQSIEIARMQMEREYLLYRKTGGTKALSAL